MENDSKIVCPKCGRQLLFCVKADSSLRRKINKNGRLSKVVHEGARILTDIYYLECDTYGCDFLYNLSYPETNNSDYRELDNWYEEFGENFMN